MKSKIKIWKNHFRKLLPFLLIFYFISARSYFILQSFSLVIEKESEKNFSIQNHLLFDNNSSELLRLKIPNNKSYNLENNFALNSEINFKQISHSFKDKDRNVFINISFDKNFIKNYFNPFSFIDFFTGVLVFIFAFFITKIAYYFYLLFLNLQKDISFYSQAPPCFK